MDLQASTKDARGRVLQEGDEIILNVRGPIYFRIAAIVPNLDPASPPGMLFVHVGAMIPFAVKRGMVNPEFIRVRTLEEAGPTNFSLIDAQPAPSPDPPAKPRLVDPGGSDR